jgi:tRNA pseudouridine55 synthase
VARRRKGRDVNGVIVLDKPPGYSSNDAVQRAKRLFGAKKVGHTGALDPLATGVLPLCLGEATKFSQYLLASDKKYWTRVKLGVSTDSCDADGQVIATAPVVDVTPETVEAALEGFRGDIQQVPSMFSAVKHNGQPLYKLARQGIEVERKARTVSIYANELLSVEDDEFELEIHCSKGTYVRTLAADLGDVLGCGGHVIALRRLAAGPYTLADMHTFDDLEAAREAHRLDDLLQPVSSTVGQWPAVELPEASAYYMRQGQPVIVAHAPTCGWVQLLESADTGDGFRFIGVGEILDDGRVAPRRLVVGS